MPIWLWAIRRRSGASMRHKMGMHSTSEFITMPTTPGFHRLRTQVQQGKCNVTTYGKVPCWALGTLLFQSEWIVGNWKYDSVGEVLSQAQDLSLSPNPQRRSQRVWCMHWCYLNAGEVEAGSVLASQTSQPRVRQTTDPSGRACVRIKWTAILRNNTWCWPPATACVSTQMDCRAAAEECWPNPEKASSLQGKLSDCFSHC